MIKMTMRALRVNAGLTQGQVSAELGVSLKTLVNWEQGKTYPNVLQLAKMAALYKCSLDDFLIE